MVEAANLKKHLGLAEKSFLTLGKKAQAKVGGRLKKLLHTVTDGAFLPLMNFCLEKCQVRIICALKGIKTDELSSSLQLKVEDVKKEEPKEGPKDEVKEEPIDSDVDERMAEANADIEAQVWNTMNKDHGNDKEESECASRPQQYQLQVPPKHQDYDHHQVMYQHHPQEQQQFQQQPPPHVQQLVHYVQNQVPRLQSGQKMIVRPPPHPHPQQQQHYVQQLQHPQYFQQQRQLRMAVHQQPQQTQHIQHHPQQEQHRVVVVQPAQEVRQVLRPAHCGEQPKMLVLENGQKIIVNKPPFGGIFANGQPVRIAPLQGARPVTEQAASPQAAMATLRAPTPHQQEVRRRGGGVVRQWQQG